MLRSIVILGKILLTRIYVLRWIVTLTSVDFPLFYLQDFYKECLNAWSDLKTTDVAA